jgi:hypothetical protein
MMCQPWVLCMEFGKPRAYDGEHDTYFHDFITIQEDVFGKQQKDMDAKLTQFKECFADDLVFKDHKALPMMGLKLFVPIKFFGSNGQEDNLKQDKEDAQSASDKQTEWQMKFDKKMKELIVQKGVAGSRTEWFKLCKQGKHRNLRFDEWMAVKDIDNNMESIPAHLR